MEVSTIKLYLLSISQPHLALATSALQSKIITLIQRHCPSLSMSSPSVTPSSANLSAGSDRPAPSPFTPQEWSVACDTNKAPTYTVRQSTNGGYQYPGPFLAVCSDMPPNSKMFCATGTPDGITRYGWQIGHEEDVYAHGTVLEIDKLGQDPDRAEKIRALVRIRVRRWRPANHPARPCCLSRGTNLTSCHRGRDTGPIPPMKLRAFWPTNTGQRQPRCPSKSCSILELRRYEELPRRLRIISCDQCSYSVSVYLDPSCAFLTREQPSVATSILPEPVVILERTEVRIHKPVERVHSISF
jgi:hypothetical protein